jgi:hypothetical protein
MTNTWGFELTEIDLPDFDLPREKPVVAASTYRTRLELVYTAMQERGLDALAV